MVSAQTATYSVAVLSVMLTASATMKLVKGTDHEMFGPGKLFPGWFGPVAAVQEYLTVLLLWKDRPLGLVGLAGFVGGVLYTMSLEDGPARQKGPQTLAPVMLVSALMLVVANSLTQKDGVSTILRSLGLPSFLQRFNAFTGSAALIGGCVAGTMIRAL
eukprot:TRINITY_DN1007_c0_g1_i2.p1 TRINITY_DN1007_c0_g1~~TRINITY_DN1007_c0_g1_i2.p1  ORF type:complete len:179 (+),score=60.33 TRINITY_DN1007_c0_g1_i2:61-537(+)